MGRMCRVFLVRFRWEGVCVSDGWCVCVWKEEVAEGFGWTEGGMGGGGRWYTLVPVSPLIKSSLNEPEGEHTHTHTQHARTQSHTQ